MLEIKDHKRNNKFCTPLKEILKKNPINPAGTVYTLVGTSLYAPP